MFHRAKDLSDAQRAAIEGLLGRSLGDDEGFSLRPVRVIKDAPTGEERRRVVKRYLERADALADRARDIPDAELDALIDEACEQARHDS